MRAAALLAAVRRRSPGWLWQQRAAISTTRRLSAGRVEDDDDDLLRDVVQEGTAADIADSFTPIGSPEQTLTQRLAATAEVEVNLVKLARAPAQYDVLQQTDVFRWQTTAKYGRKLMGPMREWAEEFQCRTGVHVTMEPTFPDKANAGGYENADDVEVNLFFFGSQKAMDDAYSLIKAMTCLQPAYVRCALYRKNSSGDVEWLTLRRINRERRPADIPPISLKTPGKYTMLFENVEEAVLRTVYEETGVDLDRKELFKTNVFTEAPPMFYWRPSVHYYIAELPSGVTVTGPQVAPQTYMSDWDPRMLRQSQDPIDRVWAADADAKTGTAWLKAPTIDDLQRPVKMEDNYMVRR